MDHFMYICENEADEYDGLVNLLSIVLAQPLLRIFYSIQKTFEQNLDDLERQVTSLVHVPTDRVCIFGCTLGGYLAMHMRHEGLSHAVAINPLVFPALQWKTRLYPDIQSSYRSTGEPHSVEHRRDIVLFSHTLGVDAELVHSYFESADTVIKMPCTKSNVNMAALASIINYGLMPHTFEEGWRGAYVHHDELRTYIGEYNALYILPLYDDLQTQNSVAENVCRSTGFLNLAGCPWLILHGANPHRPALMIPCHHKQNKRHLNLCTSLAQHMGISQTLSLFADGNCIVHHTSSGFLSQSQHLEKEKRTEVIITIENFLSKYEQWNLQEITPCMQQAFVHGSQKILQKAFVALTEHSPNAVQLWLESVPSTQGHKTSH